MRHFTLILLIFCVVGCGGKWVGMPAEKALTAANIQSSDYAYVLAGVSGCTITTWLHTSVPSDVKKPNPDEGVVLAANQGWNCSVKYQLNVVKPGRYTMIHFSQSSGNSTFRMTAEGRAANEQMKHTSSLVGSFVADKGTVTYIGTLQQKVNYSERRYSFTVDDESDEAKEFIKKKYPNIDPESIIYRPAVKGVTNY